MIPFNRPEFAGNETIYLSRCLEQGGLGRQFSRACEAWLAKECSVEHVHLVQSATAGLELAVLLCELGPGDEVILPSFTFVACANAIVLRGATPVFADIDPRTLNIDPVAVEASLTPRTRAILAVHYAGVPCEMDALRAMADRHGLFLIEDAAQALLSSSLGRPAGSLGDIGVFSFHHSKNVTCGEGGAVVINAKQLALKAELMHQHGTNRASFLRNDVDHYKWLCVGSSFAPSDITAAVLLAQLERAHDVTRRRCALWEQYQSGFEGLENDGHVRRPIVPPGVAHNGHIYYLLLENQSARNALIETLKAHGIEATFHYVPLHSSPAGIRYARPGGRLAVTEDLASRLVRLPLWPGMASAQEQIIRTVIHAFGSTR
ncbi:MAG: dTDP-4-amino-4,6-dideoxygalactose transaminase [Hyphomonadaceae bacterium]